MFFVNRKVKWPLILAVWLVGLPLGTGCMSDQGPDPGSENTGPVADLEVGDIADIPADGYVGHALECKPIPELEPLIDPAIVISIDGLTLHLYDRAGDFDRVYAVGVGTLSNGRSLTPIGRFRTSTNTQEVRDGGWGYYYPCRIWWTSRETGRRLPVFAGLPFIRLKGTSVEAYGIHGPVDRYYDAEGGKLNRGYVSHGCIRMAAPDIVEVYARIKGVGEVPVTIRQETESDASDVPLTPYDSWVGDACDSNEDCAYEGGYCRMSSLDPFGFCSLECDRYCPDMNGRGVTFCVDPGDDSEGYCAIQSSYKNNASCTRYSLLEKHRNVPRYSMPSVTADVCLPPE